MIKVIQESVIAENNTVRISNDSAYRNGTMAWSILQAHNTSEDPMVLKLKFDAMVSPDNNYVNILQTAKASGLQEFPMPYVLSNCHNTLCAVGGTIAEDDHVFGLSNAKKYGGIFVPRFRAVLHQYMREMMAVPGMMILGSDSHTRYGALGTMGIGEGGGELVKQLLGQTYDLPYPHVTGVRLTGAPRPGVGPMDAALLLISHIFGTPAGKNAVLEFFGEGIASLSMEYRMCIDAMTTESGALSSIWQTDEKTARYLKEHGRGDSYRELKPGDHAYYDSYVEIDLSSVECMIALPFHPSNAVTIHEFSRDPEKYIAAIEAEGNRAKNDPARPFTLRHCLKDGGFYPDQALISGCEGGLSENLAAAADILDGVSIPADGLNLYANPASLPIMQDLMKQGVASRLAVSGVVLREAICGPCFGVTDTPADNSVSIRHVTRNYMTREGSRPKDGQFSAVCLMDARSIAATVRNHGRLTAASDLDVTYTEYHPVFDASIYAGQVSDFRDRKEPEAELIYGPNIADWPEMAELRKHLLLKVTGSYEGSVTTDELIPSGEASSYRSNPEKLSAFTLVNKDPGYVQRCRSLRSDVHELMETGTCTDEIQEAVRKFGCSLSDLTVGSLVVSDMIGDGSSREQAASSQKVLGGFANLANEYATKRYRSNLINWGILPLETAEDVHLPVNTWAYIDTEELIRTGKGSLITEERTIPVSIGSCSEEEKKILRSGCLINYYRKGKV
ncbi:MAG TPA: hydratase [Erysipelotrichaceae bacterium]|nr:hydratase [Erysipelotrichaceae bacterium]